ncbi:hypothetical protein ACIP79_19385 [Streptomyces sp. NPDC088747]|uniref:hypothetical protein n=1 Tax=Streptomyces sp. NPDC088747 TaxID=3365886 RepID=UPI0038262BFE
MVHRYDVTVTDAATGAQVFSTKVSSEYHFMPRTNTLAVPVASAVAGRPYTAEFTAVDANGNTSPVASTTFTK